MQAGEITDAMAYLSEQINELRAEQNNHNKAAEESLKQWSQINLELLGLLQGQSEDSSGAAEQRMRLATYLLELGQTTQKLTSTTSELKASSKELTRSLEEKQIPELSKLSQRAEALTVSSTSLEQYLTGEQAKRLKLLEEGMRSLIEIIDTSPPFQNAKAQKLERKNLSYSSLQGLASIGVGSVLTGSILLALWHFGGVGSEIARIGERSIWAITKLERIEAILNP